MPYPPFGAVSKSYYFDPHHGGKDFYFDAARGTYLGIQTVNKFGFTSNADSGVATDIWDGANPTEDDDIWLAPTAARVHAITSNDVGDTAAGAGARTVRVYGLRTWDTPESFEDITLNGAGAVNTIHSYVIVHRLKVLTSGATSANIGDIFATAAVDGTITAMIIATSGQTEMAVYGIPSTQTAYLTSIYGGGLRASPTGFHADVSLFWCFDVKNQPKIFQLKFRQGLDQEGATHFQHGYSPPNPFSGPGILKLQTVSSNNDTFIQGGFDLVLEDKA